MEGHEFGLIKTKATLRDGQALIAVTYETAESVSETDKQEIFEELLAIAYASLRPGIVELIETIPGDYGRTRRFALVYDPWGLPPIEACGFLDKPEIAITRGVLIYGHFAL